MAKDIKKTLLILLTVTAIFLSIGLFNLKERQKTLKEEAALNLNILRSSLNKLQDTIKDKEKLKTQLEKRLSELSSESASLEVQITQIKKIYEETEGELTAIEKDIPSSQNTIKDLLIEKKRLTTKISSTESEILELGNRLTALKQTTAALERHLRKMMRVSGTKPPQLQEKVINETEAEIEPFVTETPSGAINLGTVTLEEPISVNKRATLEGEILVVNREFNFIVISLGKQDGLKEGDSLDIYDGDKLLGTVQVETVRENISAASGGKDLDAYRMRAGNKVRIRP